MENKWYTFNELRDEAQRLALYHSEAWEMSFIGAVDVVGRNKTFGLHGSSLYGVCHITRSIEESEDKLYRFISKNWTVKFDQLPYNKEGLESLVDVHNYIMEVLEQGREYHITKYLKDIQNELRDIIVSDDRDKEEAWEIVRQIGRVVNLLSETRDGILLTNILSYVDVLISGREEIDGNKESIEDLKFIKEQIHKKARKADTKLLEVDKLKEFYLRNKELAKIVSEKGIEAGVVVTTVERTLEMLGIDTSILE